MSNLVKYNAARIALSEAHAIDEVKDIRDKAEAMAAYARQAKDTEMIQWVTEIKVRAERRAGQMLAELPKSSGAKAQLSGRNSSGGHIVVPPEEAAQTLDSLGITKNESSRWQKLASVSDEKFEHAVAAAKEVAGEVTTAAMLRAVKPVQEAPIAKPPKLEIVSDELANIRAENEKLKAWGNENAQTAKELLEENNSMAAVFDQDEKLSASVAECKKLREMNRVLEERIRGLMNEKNEAIRAAKSWQRKAEQAMKAA